MSSEKSKGTCHPMVLAGVGALELYIAAINSRLDLLNEQAELLRAVIAEKEKLLRAVDGPR
jgi:hypothetical protein